MLTHPFETAAKNSYVMIPENLNTDTVDKDGLSVRYDLALFRSLIYHTITGSQFEIGICKPPKPVATQVTEPREQQCRQVSLSQWPRDQELHSTVDLFLGDMICKCWAKNECQNMEEVCHAVRQPGPQAPHRPILSQFPPQIRPHFLHI